MTCPHCGQSVADDHLFCAGCGAPVQRPASQDGPPTTVLVPAASPEPTEHVPPSSAETEAGATPVMVQPLAPCPRCGAQNSSRREHCARCHTPLAATDDQDDRGPWADEHGDGPGAAAPPRRSRRGLWVGVALVGLAGLAVGGAALTGAGVLDGGEGDGDRGWDPAAYPDEPRALAMPRIVADTEHEPIGDNRYDISLVDDGDPATAWNSDGDIMPDGIGEQIRIELAEPAWLVELQLANGYQKSRKSFTDNARPTRVRLTLDGATYELELLDQEGRQSIELDRPRLTTRLLLEVLEVQPGTTYEDLAISELVLLGHVAVGDDVEQAELQRGGGTPPLTPEVGEDAADG